MNNLSEIRGECLNSLYECTDNLLKHAEGNYQSEQLKTLQSLVKKYCILDFQTQVCEEALESVIEGVDATSLSSIDGKFIKILKDLVSRHPNIDDHQAMIEFKSKLNIPQQPDFNESDIVETESSQVFIDPFTKKRIVTPVKNKICGHVYEKSTITAMIKKKATLKCPVMGCGNRQHITQSSLQLDENLQMKLSQIERDPLEDSD